MFESYYTFIIIDYYYLYLQPPGPRFLHYFVEMGPVKGFYWRLWGCFLILHIRPYLSPPLTPIRNPINTVNLATNLCCFATI